MSRRNEQTWGEWIKDRAEQALINAIAIPVGTAIGVTERVIDEAKEAAAAVRNAVVGPPAPPPPRRSVLEIDTGVDIAHRGADEWERLSPPTQSPRVPRSPRG